MTNPTGIPQMKRPRACYPDRAQPPGVYEGTDLEVAIRRFLAEGYALTARGDDWAHLQMRTKSGCGTFLLLGATTWLVDRCEQEKMVWLYTDASGGVWARRREAGWLTNTLWVVFWLLLFMGIVGFMILVSLSR